MSSVLQVTSSASVAPPTLHPQPTLRSRDEPRFEAVWARDEEDVRAAQRLRWLVFAQEMGARLKPPPGTPPGLDADVFDPHCEHLLVRTVPGADEPAEVVGTYRVLTPAAARRAGGFYTDGEFDLVRLRGLRPRMAELGRSCTHPRWRGGAVILALWGSLGQFLQRNRIEYVFGCASVSMADGGQLAANLWQQLQRSCPAPLDMLVRPRLPLPVEQLCSPAPVQAPALIKGYLRCGARLLGQPAWDPDFGTADLPLMLQLADLAPSYRRRFIGD